jgi:hypothetical protein
VDSIQEFTAAPSDGFRQKEYIMRKNTNFYIIVILATMSSLMSQTLKSETEFEFDGYIYIMPMMQSVSDLTAESEVAEIFFGNLTRLRLRPTINFSENSRLTVHYEIDMNFSEINMSFDDLEAFTGGLDIPGLKFSDISNRQAVDLSDDLYNNGKFTSKHYIDRFYYKHIFDWGEVVLGRQRISWGVGRVWQPTDLFNPINPANYSKFEKDGADAVSVKYFIGNFTDLELVYSFGNIWKDADYGARFRTNYKKFDISLMSGYFDNRIVIGSDLAGDIIYGIGFRAEAIASFNESHADSNFVRAIAGLDYQFNADWYGVIEYQFNGEGRSCLNCAGAELFNDFIRLIKGEIQNLGRHYLTGLISWKVGDLTSLSLNNITNLNDQSGFVGGGLSYSASDNINLKANAMFFYGDKMTEYSYYPNAAFLTFEYYF